jgi:hypothetical protein
MTAYGSEGWGFESLRARGETVSETTIEVASLFCQVPIAGMLQPGGCIIAGTNYYIMQPGGCI